MRTKECAQWSIDNNRPGASQPPVPRILDQRLGRAVVLEQAVNDAVPHLYDKAVADSDVRALGQPDLEITKLDDGQQLAFTAEVDIRPRFELPDLGSMQITVDDAEV